MSTAVKITRILAPTDFSAAAEAACGLAARLAMRAEAGLVVFHALSGVEMAQKMGPKLERTQVSILNDVRDRLQEWFEAAVPAELRRFLEVEFNVKVGEPTPAIAGATKRSGVDLVVMATEGRTGLAHLLLGSVAAAVLRTVSVPVLALRAGQADRPLATVRRVLWATDFSPASEGAWPYAVMLADLFAAEVLLVHVVRPAELAGIADAPVPPSPHWMGRYLEPLEHELERRQQEVEALGLRASRKVLMGPPAEIIVEEAGKEQADLIVMGTHGRTGLGHILVGSVAEAVIRKAPCPVLAVRVRREGDAQRKDVGETSTPAEAPSDAD